MKRKEADFLVRNRPESSCCSRSCCLFQGEGSFVSSPRTDEVTLWKLTLISLQTVLLDDPLSAIDMHTARHIYHKCLKGPLMEHRTIVSHSPSIPLPPKLAL